MLVRTALREAKAGNPAMLIFCLKNLCGWADKQEVEQKQINMTYEEFIKGLNKE